MSVSVNLDLSGAEEVARALNHFDGAMKNRIQEQLSMWAESVKIDAERLVPIRTGLSAEHNFCEKPILDDRGGG